jgi:type 1 glutamine amidotransferase
VRRTALALLALALALAAGLGATGRVAREAEPRVLVVTAAAGFRHSSIPVAQEALRLLGARSRQYDTILTDDLDELSAGPLRRYRAVVFALTSGELPLSAAQKAAVIRFVQRGGGLVGVHSATDSLYNYPPYGRMLGAYFRDHPYTTGVLMVEGPRHPATAGMPERFPVSEELYRFQSDPRATGARVILRLDPATVPGAAPGEDLPLAWCAARGRGRAVYTAPGHFDSTWRSGWFRRHLDGAIAWAAGRRGQSACR